MKDTEDAPEYNVNQEPIILSKPLLDLLLKQGKDAANLIALYSFYYYTAKWQRTNQPKCTQSYIAKGLSWSQPSVVKYKQLLINLGLVENIRKGNSHFIRVNFIWSACTIKNFNSKNFNTNSLSTNNLNTREPEDLKKNVSAISPINKKFIRPATRLFKIILKDAKENGGPIPKKSDKLLNEYAQNIRLLKNSDKVSEEKIKQALSWYSKNYGLKYTPVIKSGKAFRNKFGQILDAIKRENEDRDIEEEIKTKASKDCKYRWEILKIEKAVNSISHWAKFSDEERYILDDILLPAFADFEKEYKTKYKRDISIINLVLVTFIQEQLDFLDSFKPLLLLPGKKLFNKYLQFCDTYCEDGHSYKKRFNKPEFKIIN